ncbi:MAG: PAS domain S-box protein, partial [Candidatus Neomarinimicrobiota bacterium]
MADLFLIDDQAEVLASYTQILTGALPDLQITTFSSAEAALESLKSTEPDLILADVALPGMSGWDLCREIRSRIPDRHLPLVLITGVRTRPEDKIRGLEAGAELYLTKPVDPGELVAQVKAMLRLKSLEDELREEKRTLEQRVRQQAIDLLETESQFQMLYQSLSIGMYRSTPDGEVLLANDALAHMLGYDSADELLSRNLNDGIYEPGYDRSAFLRRLEAEGRIQGLESIWRRRDGTEIYVRESAWARRDEKGAILSIDGTVEDITREREIRTELENERLLFRSGPMVVFRWRAGEDSIPVDYVSPNVESIYGYSVQEFLEGNLGYKELIHPEDRQRVEKEVAAYVEQNRPSFNQRYRLRDKQGSYHWVHDLTAVVRDRQGRVSSYVGFITDITEMMEISRELEKKDVLIRQVFEQAMEGIIVTDEAGTISEWSHGMETITGLGAEEVQGRPIWEIQARFVPRKQQSPRLEDRIRKEIEGILQTGEFKHFNPAAIFPLQST